LKSLLTSPPFTVTASLAAASVAGTVTCTSTSPPLTKSGRVETVRICERDEDDGRAE
jgi:hypothetical protein